MSFLIVKADLPESCRMVSWVFCVVLSVAALITHIHDTPAHQFISSDLSNGESWTFRTKIQFHSEALLTENQSTTEQLLQPLGRMIHGMQKFTISNAEGVQKGRIKSLLKRMEPKSIWTTAMVWHLLDVTQEMKSRADKLVRSRPYYYAARWYRFIIATPESSAPFALPEKALSSDIANPLAFVCCIIVEAAAMYGLLQIRIGQANREEVQPSSRAFNAVQRFVEERMATASLRSVTLNVMTRTYWFVDLVYFAIGRTEDAIDVALERFTGTSESLRDDPHFLHDFEPVRECAEVGEVSSHPSCDVNIVRRSEWYQRRAAYINPSLRNNLDTAFFEATSAYQLPIKVFSTPMPAEKARRYGWLCRRGTLREDQAR